MKWLIAPVLMMATGPNTPYFSGTPPLRYQVDGVAPVVFASNVELFCGAAPEGMTMMACVRQLKSGGRLMVLPNPCPLADYELFAKIACHELGHHSGNWPADHPE